jgi:hypothetical protein
MYYKDIEKSPYYVQNLGIDRIEKFFNQLKSILQHRNRMKKCI